MAFKLCDSNKRVIGNITDVVRTVDGETMITLDTGHTFQFKSYDIYWDKGHNCFINKPYYRGTLNTAHAKEATAMNAAVIKNVIFAPPATIVYWSDGSKTVVKCSEKDVFDPEKGLAMAIAKRCGGNRGQLLQGDPELGREEREEVSREACWRQSCRSGCAEKVQF